MRDLVFVVREAPEGGYVASAIGESIVTDADDLDALKLRVREAVLCHFEEDEAPAIVTLLRTQDPA